MINILGKLPFSPNSDSKKEKGVVPFTHEQNIICSQTQLDGIAHEQTSHLQVVVSWPMKRKKDLLGMIIKVIVCVFIRVL